MLLNTYLRMPTQHHHHSHTKHRRRRTAVREKVGLQRVNSESFVGLLNVFVLLCFICMLCFIVTAWIFTSVPCSWSLMHSTEVMAAILFTGV